MKTVLFNGKDSDRIIDKDDNTILVPDTQQNEPEPIETISESDNLNTGDKKNFKKKLWPPF